MASSLKIDFGATKGQLAPQESLTIVRRPHGMTTSSLLSHVFAVLALSSSAAQSPEKWQKILLTDAAKSGAVCLDGSPGGFYLRRGSANKWIVFHQGGGWCGSHGRSWGGGWCRDGGWCGGRCGSC